MKVIGLVLGLGLLVGAGIFALQQRTPEEVFEEPTPVDGQVVQSPILDSTDTTDEEVEDHSQFTSQFFANISNTVAYDHATVSAIAPMITGDTGVDTYVRTKAEARGYRMRPVADSESRLVSFVGQRLQPEALESLKKLQADAKKEGMTITFVSGYRSQDYQRGIFTKKLGIYDKEDLLAGKLDTQLDAILEVSSIPGYSKHHSGYTIDIACNSYELTNVFMQTNCYKWLAKDNFKNARAYNFIPSYPIGIENQGPDPESWEFIWVPGDLLK